MVHLQYKQLVQFGPLRLEGDPSKTRKEKVGNRIDLKPKKKKKKKGGDK